MRALILTNVLILILGSCSQKKQPPSTASTQRSKFEPADGEVLLFVGQELDAVGGLATYNNGYFDHFDAPAGFTMYTNISPGDTSFGYINKGLDGLKFEANWGDSTSCMQYQIDDPDFKNSALAIGLSIVNHEAAIGKGERDSYVTELGKWIKALGQRPVFLRIGYEFDGDWNHYEPSGYKEAFKRIHQIFDSLNVKNVAFIWQATGWGSSKEKLMTYYPGDSYVDWCAISYFDHYPGLENLYEPMISIAQEKSLPLFISEATPMIGRKSRSEADTMSMSNHIQAERAWNEWFIPFFKLINQYPETIKAFSYINANWQAHQMWQGSSPFGGIDARLHLDEQVSKKWKEEVSKEKYLKANDRLFEYLWKEN